MQKTFAERLIYARKLRGLSQSELSFRADMKPSTLGNLEQGTSQSARKLVQLAEALRVRPEWLASGTLPMETATSISEATLLKMAQQLERLGGAQPSEASLTLAQTIEKLSAPQLSAVRAMIDAFTDTGEIARAAPAPTKIRASG